MFVQVTDQPITLDPAMRALELTVHGAIVSFLGTVRRYSGDRVVQYLDYEAYPEMADEKLRQVADEAKAKYRLEDIAIIHRIGRLYVGEASLAVALGSPHRREGFDACLYVVESIKEIVPIWKKEVWASGAVWVNAEKA